MDNLGCVAKYRVDSAPEDHFQSELHGYYPRIQDGR